MSFYTWTRNWRSMMIHRFDWFEEPRDPRRRWPGLLKDGRSGRWAPRIVAAIHSSQLSLDLGRTLSLIIALDKMRLMWCLLFSGLWSSHSPLCPSLLPPRELQSFVPNDVRRRGGAYAQYGGGEPCPGSAWGGWYYLDWVETPKRWLIERTAACLHGELALAL